MPQLSIEDYHVGIICALDSELAAVEAMLDEEHDPVTIPGDDSNAYSLGRIRDHNVAIACLPAGVDGLAAAASVASNMLRTFGQLRFGLLVGIGGGVPDLERGIDIRLGDIVVSQPSGSTGGVVQYDKGKSKAGGEWERKGMLNAPPKVLLTALQRLKARHLKSDSQVPSLMTEMLQQHPKMATNGFAFPGQDQDCLKYSSPRYVDGKAVYDVNDEQTTALRPLRKTTDPEIYYGIIASGNQVVKDAAVRDRLGQDCGALCVEMEAAGLMNDFPCLVIRGICDYADAYKNDQWHRYAAATAAAYAKELLLHVSAEQTEKEKPAQQILGILTEQLRESRNYGANQAAYYQRQEVRYQNDQHRSCHQAFKTCNYEQFKNINPIRIEQTCQWALKHPLYCRWIDSTSDNLLWISADPGCGKSVLSKSLVDEALQEDLNNTTICYFFFKDNDEQNSVNTALCAVLHQLFAIQPHLLQHAMPAWEKNGDKIKHENDELWRILLATTLDTTAHNVVCVLDALDECRDQDRGWLIAELLRFHHHAVPRDTDQPWLKFVVTSRPYEDIERGFQQATSSMPLIRLRGEEENGQIRTEIDRVIKARIKELGTELDLQPQTTESLERRLLEMEHRTYLWLHLAIDDIRVTYRDSLWEDEGTIRLLPSSVEDAYEKILARVTQDQKSRVKTILQIILGARRPLSVLEMAIALSAARPREDGTFRATQISTARLEKSLRQGCGLFVFVNHSRIYLIHQTAREFLLCQSSRLTPVSEDVSWRHCISHMDAEATLARICVSVLLFRDETDSRQVLGQLIPPQNDSESMVEYSCEWWADHFRSASPIFPDTLLKDSLRLYNTTSRIFRFWYPRFYETKRPWFRKEKPAEMTEVRLAAFNGHESILEHFLTMQEHDIDGRDEDGRNALYWASRRGYDRVVQMLLDRGADVNAQGGEYGNSLYAASYKGYDKIVQMLLDRGADVNAKDEEYGNALQAASELGYEKIVQILLDRGVDVNAQGRQYGNALYRASEKGYDKIVQMLLGKGADVNAQGGQYGNALQTASYEGYDRIVQMLLDRGADVNAKDIEYGNALYRASEKGYDKIVQMLLGKGADVNAQGGWYGNALQVASYEGYDKIVQMLLDRGADIKYSNALQVASSRGYDKIVQMLLDRGANVNAQGGWYGNALQAASELGYEKIVQILLDRGVDVNAQGRQYGNALYRASEKGYDKIVQMLLGKGADVNAQGGQYGNALQAASEQGCDRIVQMLLDRGADIKYSDALYRASEKGYDKIVQMLLDKGADVNAQGGQYGNALQAASYEGYDKIVQMLLDRGADVNAQGGWCGNALQAAFYNCHDRIVQMLLHSGATSNVGQDTMNVF